VEGALRVIAIVAVVAMAGSVRAQSYSAFNTHCWDNTGASYAKEPIQNIQLVVPGGATATPNVSVTLTSVKEN